MTTEYQVDTHLAEYQHHLRDERCLAQRSIDSYARNLAQFRRFLDQRLGRRWSWNDIDGAAVASYIDSLSERGLSPRTRVSKAYSCRGFFKFLHEKGLVRTDLAKFVEPDYARRSLPGHLSDDELEHLLGYLVSPRVSCKSGVALRWYC